MIAGWRLLLRSLAQRRHQEQHTLMLAHGDVVKGRALAALALKVQRARRGVKLALKAEETQRLLAASHVVREETRDDPTLKCTGATSPPQAGNPKRRGLTAAARRPEAVGWAPFV